MYIVYVHVYDTATLGKVSAQSEMINVLVSNEYQVRLEPMVRLEFQVNNETLTVSADNKTTL